MAMAFLDKAGMAYEHVIADENRELVEQFDIHQAPTLVVVRGGTVEKIVNVSNIRKFIEANS
jgi:ribonucleoside-triphosphate reductase